MQGFDFQIILDSLPYLLGVGMVFTLKLTVLATVFALILGTLLAMMRLSSNRLVSGVAGSYVNF
ncbi:MAG TPA: amino acid ABC transporter permease, partial [Pusillimonas sp.]|nr:amino acid ABC transporter permease [Pusillimonas sp.]